MSCDIHLFIEFKVGNKKWEADPGHIVEVDGDENDEDAYRSVKDVDASDRHYALFGKLAGVRCNGPEAKGLPKDVSERIALASELYDCDGHSHSYSTLAEFEKALIKAHGDDGESEKAEIIKKIQTAEPVAFYDWQKSSERYGYHNLIAYCKKKVQDKIIELEAEKHLLGQKGTTKVQCRLVYFFDN